MWEQNSILRQGLAVTAIGVALYGQSVVRGNPDAASGWVILGIAALIVALAGWSRRVAPSPVARPSLDPVSAVGRCVYAAAAVLAVAATTALSLNGVQPVLTLALWFAGFFFASVAVRRWIVSTPAREDLPWSTRELVLLGAILVLAAAARVAWIDTLPRGYFGDETRVGMFLLNNYRAGIPNFFTMGWNTWPIVGLSLQGIFAPFLGLSMTTLRLSSALMGTLAVLTTYLLARELVGIRLAVLAAFLFAICRTAIDFSRLGICHAQVLFYQTLAFYFWWRALNTGRAIHYLWSGIGLGLGLYTYNAGQLVPLLLIGWIGVSIVFAPRVVRTHWRGAGLVLAGFLLALVPYLFYFTDVFTFGQNWGQWTIMARNRQTMSQVMDAWHTGGFSAVTPILSRQVWLTWLGFGVLPGAGYHLGYRGGGMLNEVTAPLFVLGLAMSIPRLFRARSAFVSYWWIVTVIAGGVLTISPPAVVRMVGLLPALALLAALPLDWLIRTSAGRLPRRVIGLGVAGALLAGAAWDNWRTYFVALADETADHMSELARSIKALPDDATAVLLGAEHHLVFHQELFLVDLPGRVQDIPDPAHFLPIHRPVESPLAIVLGPTQVTLTDYARSLYPKLTVTDVIHSRNRRMLFRILLLQPEHARQRAGLTMLAQARGSPRTARGIGDPFAPTPEIAGDVEHVSWEGSVYWPTHEPVTLAVETDAPIAVELAGSSIMQPDGSPSVRRRISLPRGWHPLRIDERGARPRRLSMSMQYGTENRPLTRWDFRPDLTLEGLRASYRRNDQEMVRAIDPQPNAIAVEGRFHPPNEPMIRMPFSASWEGVLHIDRTGVYELEAIGSGPYSLRLDGEALFDVARVVPEKPVTSRASRRLSAGGHPLVIQWDSTKPAHTWRRIFQLYWTPPGRVRALIPPTHFSRE